MSETSVNWPMPQARAQISQLPPYSHAFTSETPPSYRSSSNESPWPPSEKAVAAAIDAVRNANRYPALHASSLVDALAVAYGRKAESIAVGDGSLSLMTYLLLAFTNRGDEVVHAWRSYEAYPIAITAAGGTPVRVPLTSGGRHDLPSMANAISGHTVAVIVCSPNNPTGAAVSPDELVEFLERVPREVLVIFDQAYEDFTTEGRDDKPFDALTLLQDHPNLVVLRTFSKSYALAGLRVGYAIADPAVLRPVKAIQPPFPVSSPAIAAAVAALSDNPMRAKTIEAAVTQRGILPALLTKAGIPVNHSDSNFLWLPLGDKSEEFALACSRARIAVRCFPGEGVRISLGEPGLVNAVRSAAEANE